MKYFSVDNLIIFKFVRPEVKFDCLFWPFLLHIDWIFQKSLRSTGGLKYSKELMVQMVNLFKIQSQWLWKQKGMIQAETNNGSFT